MSTLIGLHGRRGHGKDTAFEGIHQWASERGVRAARRGFADALKLSFARLFIPDCGLDEAVNWCDTLKRPDSHSDLSVSWSNDSESGTHTTITHSINGRQALQRFGTEGHRDVFGEDFWIDALLPTEGDWSMNFRQEMDFSFEPPEFCVVTDVRFENEARRIKALGGDVYAVFRPGMVNGDTHASEGDLPPDLIDYTLRNDTTIDDLHLRMRNFMGNVYA